MNNAECILVVDDEKSIRIVVADALEAQGYRVEAAGSAAEALSACERQSHDLALVDLRLPGPMDGLALLRELRRRCPQMIVIVLTGYGSLDSAISAMREGAYDYLTKPASMAHIVASVHRGLSKRREEARQAQLIAHLEDTLRELKRESRVDHAGALSETDRFVQTPRLVIDRQKRLVVLDDQLIELTPTEFDLLDHLATHSDHVVTASELIRAVQGYELADADARPIVRVHLQRLRRKLGDDPKEPMIIQNVRGKGYRFMI